MQLWMGKKGAGMNKLKKTMDQILSAVCAIMFSFMTVIAVYQVVTRYVFNNPSSF